MLFLATFMNIALLVTASEWTDNNQWSDDNELWAKESFSDN